jgi:hypothetical protein
MATKSYLSPREQAEEWERVRGWQRSATTRAISQEAVHAREASAKLVYELQQAGIPLRDLEEFANVGLMYDAAIRILASHLNDNYPDLVWSQIARILERTGPHKMIHRALVDVLHREHSALSEQTLFSLGFAIAATTPKGDLDLLFELVGNSKYAVARYGPLQKLAKAKDPRVPQCLERFFDEADEHALWSAVRALRTARICSRRDEAASLTNSENYSLRDEVRAYCRACDKQTGQS